MWKCGHGKINVGIDDVTGAWKVGMFDLWERSIKPRKDQNYFKKRCLGIYCPHEYNNTYLHAVIVYIW